MRYQITSDAYHWSDLSNQYLPVLVICPHHSNARILALVSLQLFLEGICIIHISQTVFQLLYLVQLTCIFFGIKLRRSDSTFSNKSNDRSGGIPVICLLHAITKLLGIPCLRIPCFRTDSVHETGNSLILSDPNDGPPHVQRLNQQLYHNNHGLFARLLADWSHHA